jgi:hypothetical protein
MFMAARHHQNHSDSVVIMLIGLKRLVSETLVSTTKDGHNSNAAVICLFTT